MVAYNKFDVFVEDIAEKVHNLGADVLKVMLSNTLPVATNTIKANITEITPASTFWSSILRTAILSACSMP